MKNGAREMPAVVGQELIALYNSGKWSQLATASERVIARYPRNLLGWRASGKALLQLGKLPEAIEILGKVVKLAPGDADGHNDLGSAFFDLGRADDAVVSYRRAVQLNPHATEAYANLGRALCALGRFEEAAACCQQAIAVNPGSAVAHNNLGNAMGDLGRPGDAEICYRHALAINPDYLVALINLGSTLAELGRWAEAKACYRLAMQFHPSSGIAYNALGRVLSRLVENDEEAEHCLERAIALNAYDNNTYVEFGNILMRKQQTGAALAKFRWAQKLQPLITWRANQRMRSFRRCFWIRRWAGQPRLIIWLAEQAYDRHFHCVIPDTPVNLDLLRSKADVVFNMICNVDDGKEMLLLRLILWSVLAGRPSTIRA